ncbi:MAG: glucose 1-dehydrogenase [Methanobacterium paludis]|nr:glucose 1-dehydrogenase [Methanobacterium paludis]
MSRLENKVALITGATAGMGEQIAELFAKEGASVVLMARRKELLEKLVSKIKTNGGKAIATPGDVTNEEDVQNAVKTAVKEFGKLDIAVNNAGILDSITPVGDVDDDLWNKVIDVNLNGPMRIYRAAIPEMLKIGGGAFVTVSSIGGISGKVSGAAYTASKHGVIGLSNSTAWMYAKKNIRSNIIAPGFVETEMSQSLVPEKCNQQGLSQCVPAYEISPRTGEATEIAELALFLASDEAKIVSGAVVKADSGWMA